VTGECLDPRDLDQIRQIVADTCFPTGPVAAGLQTSTGGTSTGGHVGIELEAFPIRVAADATPTERIPIHELRHLLEPPAPGARAGPGPDAAWHLDGGGTLTFEPGGQLEHSTAAHLGPAGALAEVDAVAATLAATLQPHGVVLAAAGVDVWTGGAPAQQLASPRYPAMAAYLAERGPYGAVMMRDTCALQINLDLGPPAESGERWLVANLVAPIACATFAASPGSGVASGRAVAWQRLDPTRTGFPPGLVDGSSDDPAGQLTEAALAADVLLLRRPALRCQPGRPGWTFADWLRDGHPEHGRATADDLRYHLTTLFLEVRPRGFLEVRAVDALPARLRAVPVVLLAGLLDDARARAQVRAVLEPHRPRLPDLWARAATAAVADPELCALAVETWSFALAGAGRLPAGHLPPGALAQAEAFLDRFTMRGRCPADELRDALAAGPAPALAWAAQPVPTSTRTP